MSGSDTEVGTDVENDAIVNNKANNNNGKEKNGSSSSKQPSKSMDTLTEDKTEIVRVVGTRYQLYNSIGKGGFGETFLAKDLHLFEQDVVVKVLRNLSPLSTNLFLREARKMAQLDHERIPKLKAQFQEHSEYFIVQEYIQGDNLSKIIKDKGPKNEMEVCILLSDLLGVLSYIHSHQIIHRDVKLENIVQRKSDGKFFLVDFGACNQLSTLDNFSPTIVGSPGYMAPEVASGKSCLQSDLYSLGATALACVTGRKPSDLLSRRYSSRPFEETITSLVSDSKISNVLGNFLSTLLEVRLEYRQSSASAALDQLQLIWNKIYSVSSIPFPNSQSVPTLTITNPRRAQSKRRSTGGSSDEADNESDSSSKRSKTLNSDIISIDQISKFTWAKISETLSLDSSRENIYSIDPTLNSKIAFWKGSLTKLAVDVIVNAANRTFSTSRYGVNAAVHKYGGEELSAELKNMKGVPGDTKITKGHKLPSAFVFHTIGPNDGDKQILKACYRSCLDLLVSHPGKSNNSNSNPERLRSIAFCCISVGENGFPKSDAAKIVLGTVRDWLEDDNNDSKVDLIVFCFPKDDNENYPLYEEKAQLYFPVP